MSVLSYLIHHSFCVLIVRSILFTIFVCMSVFCTAKTGDDFTLWYVCKEFQASKRFDTFRDNKKKNRNTPPNTHKGSFPFPGQGGNEHNTGSNHCSNLASSSSSSSVRSMLIFLPLAPTLQIPLLHPLILLPTRACALGVVPFPQQIVLTSFARSDRKERRTFSLPITFLSPRLSAPNLFPALTKMRKIGNVSIFPTIDMSTQCAREDRVREQV